MAVGFGERSLREALGVVVVEVDDGRVLPGGTADGRPPRMVFRIGHHD